MTNKHPLNCRPHQGQQRIHAAVGYTTITLGLIKQCNPSRNLRLERQDRQALARPSKDSELHAKKGEGTAFEEFSLRLIEDRTECGKLAAKQSKQSNPHRYGGKDVRLNPLSFDQANEGWQTHDPNKTK
jgi:hypothetical protein